MEPASFGLIAPAQAQTCLKVATYLYFPMTNAKPWPPSWSKVAQESGSPPSRPPVAREAHSKASPTPSVASLISGQGISEAFPKMSLLQNQAPRESPQPARSSQIANADGLQNKWLGPVLRATQKGGPVPKTCSDLRDGKCCSRPSVRSRALGPRVAKEGSAIGGTIELKLALWCWLSWVKGQLRCLEKRVMSSDIEHGRRPGLASR